MENIINSIIDLFGGLLSLKFGKELLVFIISLLPILELRGGLLASSLIGLDPVNGYITAIIGNTKYCDIASLVINDSLGNIFKQLH